MMIFAIAIGTSLGQGVARFFAALPLNFLIALVVFVLLTSLSRVLLRRFPDSRIKPFLLLWLN